jgi:uncharacterized protein involved in exopolysaccharide biosynthesis
MEEKELTLKELITTITDWKNYFLKTRKILFIATALGLFLGVYYSFLKKPTYSALLNFSLEDEKSNSSLTDADRFFWIFSDSFCSSKKILARFKC